MRFDNRKFQSGLGLVEVLVAVAVCGILVVVTSQIFDQNVRSNSSIKNNLDKLAIKLLILDNLSCVDTLPAMTCTPGAIVLAKRKKPNGSVVTFLESTGDPTRFGQIAVRAVCNTDGESLSIQTTLLKTGKTITANTSADFSPDPLTKIIANWDHPSSNLLPTGLPLCMGASGGPPGATPDLTNCVNINVPFMGDEVARLQKCPTANPYFSGIWVSQETVGKDSDKITNIQCCR